MATQELYQRLSVMFGTDKELRYRTFIIVCREELKNTFPSVENRQFILSGSKDEGVLYPPSDDDTMILYTSQDLLVRSNVEEAVQNNAPMLIPSDIGYCLLLIPVVETHPQRDYCLHGYLHSAKWKESFVSAGYYIHGPCESGWIGSLEFDSCHCLQVPFWPEIAYEWLHRKRIYGWPSPATIQHIIIDSGCHVVPIGNPDSRASEYQWRLSFSLAERTLIHTFNHIQFLIYNLMKLVLKRIINVLEPDCICSYFIKTTMFYCIENTDSTTWNINNLGICYETCLKQLYDFVDIMFCPNYFVKENNMFKRKINQNNRPKILDVLRCLRQQGIIGVLRHPKERFILSTPVTPNFIEINFDHEIFTSHISHLLNISRLKQGYFLKESVTENLSKKTYGYSLLGWLELLRNRNREAMRYFIGSHMYRERWKQFTKILEIPKNSYTLLNMAIACKNLLCSE